MFKREFFLALAAFIFLFVLVTQVKAATFPKIELDIYFKMPTIRAISTQDTLSTSDEITPTDSSNSAVATITPTYISTVATIFQEPNPTEIVMAPPTQTPSETLNDIEKYLLDAVNSYRKSQGLSEVQTDSYTCDFANKRAEEISMDFSHDGFFDRVNSYTLPYPSNSLATENLVKSSDYKKVVSSWILSETHSQNMREDTPFVCIAKYGNYYAYEGWKP